MRYMFIPGLGDQPLPVSALGNIDPNSNGNGVPKKPPHSVPAEKCTNVQNVQVVQDVKNPLPRAGVLLKDAALAWVKSQEPHVSALTYRRLLHHLNPLKRFFGERALAECADADLIREYQTSRLKNDGAGADCINKEVKILRHTLQRAGLWEDIADDYQPLKVKPSLIGQPLAEDIERKLFAAAASKPEWRIAYFVALLLNNTVMSPSEVFFRRIRDIDLKNRWIEIPHGKTRYRMRRIPINNGDALKAVTGLLKLAREKGAVDADHFLIPYRNVQANTYDPTRHALSCRTAWRSLVRSIGEPRLRMKDFKHHDVTKLDEKGVARGVIHRLAGWSPSSRRLDDYSHVGKRSMKPLRAAVKMLSSKRA